MLIRAMLFALALLPMPAAAQETEGDEALAMRLIFDDCLGFVKNGVEPFKGLKTRVLTLKEHEQFAAPTNEGFSSKVIENRPYVVEWGALGDDRVCWIALAGNLISNPLLTVRKQEFLSQATFLAKKEGLVVGTSETNPEYGEFSWVDYSWVEPGEEETGLRILLSFSTDGELANLDSIFVMMPLPDLLN